MSETEGDPVRKETPPPMGETPPRVTRRPSAFVLVAVAALLIGAAAFTFGIYRAAIAWNDEIAGLKNRIDTMDTRVVALEKSAAETRFATAALPDVTARLGTMDTRLASLESQIARAADRDILSGLQDRVSRLETTNEGHMLRQAAAALALANLARAVESGKSFKPELDALSAIAPGDPALGPLQPWAETGVLTLAALRARFADGARAALDAERATGEGGNFFARAWASLTSLVRVRRVGDVEGTTTADRLARAEADLGRADLSGGVMEAQSVTGAAAIALAPWLKDAEGRLAVDRAVADMDSRIVQALAAQAATPEGSGEGRAAARP
jgi:hypothetical protein